MGKYRLKEGVFMFDETEELIKFLNEVKNKEEDVDKIAKIKNIVIFRNSMDIENGSQYLQEIIKDNDIEKHLQYRQPQGNYNLFGQPITKEESFIQDCNAVIVAISKSMLEDKVKDKLKNQLRPNFQSLIEIVEYYKNIFKN